MCHPSSWSTIAAADRLADSGERVDRKDPSVEKHHFAGSVRTRRVGAVRSEELAKLVDFVWDQAKAEPALLDRSSRVALLCVVDAAGARSLFIEPTAAPERPAGAERSDNVRKRLERRVAALDATAAGHAGRIDVVNFRGRFEWLSLVVADDEHDIGRIASITRDATQTAIVASHTDWHRDRPAPFDENPWPFLSQSRAAVQGALQHGLRQAAKRRRRQR